MEVPVLNGREQNEWRALQRQLGEEAPGLQVAWRSGRRRQRTAGTAKAVVAVVVAWAVAAGLTVAGLGPAAVLGCVAAVVAAGVTVIAVPALPRQERPAPTGGTAPR